MLSLARWPPPHRSAGCVPSRLPRDISASPSRRPRSATSLCRPALRTAFNVARVHFQRFGGLSFRLWASHAPRPLSPASYLVAVSARKSTVMCDVRIDGQRYTHPRGRGSPNVNQTLPTGNMRPAPRQRPKSSVSGRGCGGRALWEPRWQERTDSASAIRYPVVVRIYREPMQCRDIS
jgi:hypothetical protein